METELAAEQETLRHLMRTDPDPRVRHRAHALLLVAQGQTVAAPWPVNPFNPTPRLVRSCTVLMRWRRSRPSRSSFHTTSVSPARRALRAAAQVKRYLPMTLLRRRSTARGRNGSPIPRLRTAASCGYGLAYFNVLFVNHPVEQTALFRSLICCHPA
jgi:hypothetical protein